MDHSAEHLPVTLTPDLADAVREAVDAGEFESNTAVVANAVHEWRQRRAVQERLRADVQAGMDDIEAGRVQDFDADRIIGIGREKRSARSRSA